MNSANIECYQTISPTRPNWVAFLCPVNDAGVFQAMVFNEKSQCLMPTSLTRIFARFHSQQTAFERRSHISTQVQNLGFCDFRTRCCKDYTLIYFTPESANVWLNCTPSNITKHFGDTLGSTKSEQVFDYVQMRMCHTIKMDGKLSRESWFATGRLHAT